MKTKSVLNTICLALLVLGFTYGPSALAQINTGVVDEGGALVAAGLPAFGWRLTQKPAGATQNLDDPPFRYYNGAYFPDTEVAAWVSPSANGIAGAGGNYVYSLLLVLTDPVPSLSGVFGTDNDGAIWLNDDVPAATTGFAGFGSPTPFTLGPLAAGENWVHVRVNNGGDPTAFFVEWDQSAPPPPPRQPLIPIPTLATWSTLLLVLLIAGLGMLLLHRRRA